MAKLSDTQARLFLEPNIGVAATIRDDGTPHLSAVWVDYDGKNVLFNTETTRAKPKHLRRDPRVTVYVLDRNDQYSWVAVTGPAEIVEEGAAEHIDKLAKKYLGRDEYGLPANEKRLIVRVTPERVTGRK